MKKTTLMRMKELERNQTLEEIIRDGAARGLTDAAIAEELGISTITYYQWLKWLGAEFSRSRTVRFASEVQAAAS